MSRMWPNSEASRTVTSRKRTGAPPGMWLSSRCSRSLSRYSRESRSSGWLAMTRISPNRAASSMNRSAIGSSRISVARSSVVRGARDQRGDDDRHDEDQGDLDALRALDAVHRGGVDEDRGDQPEGHHHGAL